MENDRAAAKRRASFGRADRLRKEEQQKAAQAEIERHRRAEREKADEHRRQTDRLRALHGAERLRNHEREAGAVIEHARKIRNIDITERRELEALDVQRRSLAGRVTGLMRGAGHFARQEQAIVERHENDRWAKHRDHEVRTDKLFWTAQARRLAQVVERRDLAKSHEVECQSLRQAQERVRPHRIEARVQAVARANDNQQTQQREHVRPTPAFGPAAGQSHEIKR